MSGPAREENRNKWLASFPETNPNPVMEINAQGIITFANPATINTLKKLGFPPNPELFLPDDKEEIIRNLREGTELQEYREIKLNNSYFSENIALNRELQVVRIYAIDTTERKKVEKALRESETRLSMALDKSGAGMWDWNLTNGEIVWSSQLYELFGIDSRKTSASFDVWNSVLHPDDKESAKKHLLELRSYLVSLESDSEVKPDAETKTRGRSV